MSCIAWNCRGLGNLRTGRELVKIIQAKDPSIVFLAETMVDDVRLQIVQSNIGFDHRWVVPREGRGGGLVLFWKATINLTIEDSNKSYIDAFINKNSENEWRLMGFYGKLELARRFEAWNKLKNLNTHPEMPWLCVGDFNEITRLDEEVRGALEPTIKCSCFMM